MHNVVGLRAATMVGDKADALGPFLVASMVQATVLSLVDEMGTFLVDGTAAAKAGLTAMY